MTTEFLELAQTKIAALYSDSGEKSPSSNRCIVPLSRLVQSLPLTCHELPNLTASHAFDFLISRGAMTRRLETASNESLAGFLYANSGGGCIFVRQEDPISRRRFSVAHELGHYLLHWPLVLEMGCREDRAGEMELIEALPPSDTESSSLSNGRLEIAQHPFSPGLPPPEQMEQEADQFAAELLMPASIVQALRERFGSHWGDTDLIWRLSNEMLVSRAAMRYRLQQLGFLRDESAKLN